MTDAQPAPKTVPQSVHEVFERVRNEQHPSLKRAHIPVRFADGKQARPVQLKRIREPEIRHEADCDAVLVICPSWFGTHNPAQTSMDVRDREAIIYREIDIALMGVTLPEDGEDSLIVKHPELRSLHLAQVLRYGIDPADEDACRVADALARREELGLHYGEPMPSKFAQDVVAAQDALLSHEDGAESAFEDEDGEQGPDGTEIA